MEGGAPGASMDPAASPVGEESGPRRGAVTARLLAMGEQAVLGRPRHHPDVTPNPVQVLDTWH